MAFGEILRLVVEADTKGAVAGLDAVGRASDRALPKAQQDLDRVGHTMVSLGTLAVGAGVVIGAGMLSAGRAASDLNEVMSKSDTVFGSAANSVESFAESAAQDIGLSKRAALEAASGFGNLFDQLDFTDRAAADMSTSLTTLSSDFASFHNASQPEVVEAMTAAFRGEYDAVQRFVPTINAAAVEQRALADTGKDTAASLTAAEKAAATYKLILEGAGQAAGDFARTSDGAANRQRQFTASLENFRAELGEAALPVMQQFLSLGTGAIEMFGGLNQATGGAVGQVAAFGAVGLVVAGGASILVGKLILIREQLTGLSPAARGAAAALGAVGIVMTGISIITNAREQRAESWLDRQIGDVDTTKLAGVRDAIREVKAELDDLDDQEGKGRLVSFRGTHLFATTGDADRNEKIEQTRAKLAELEEQEKSLAAAQGATQAATAGSTGAFADMSVGMTEAIENLGEYETKLRATFDPVLGLVDALHSNAEAQTAAVEAQSAYNAAVAEFGATSPEALAAQQALTEAQNAATMSALDVSGATAEMNAAIAANPGLLQQSKDQLARWVAQGLISQDTANAMGVQFDATAAQAVALGLTDPNVNVTVSGADEGYTKIVSVRDALGQLHDKTITLGVTTALGGQAVAIMNNKMFMAAGGPVAAGLPYIVGEKGPEWFVPDVAGTVLPQRSMVSAPSMGGSGGGSTTVVNYHMTFNGPVNDTQVIESIKRFERSNGQGWRS